jgi:lysozyme
MLNTMTSELLADVRKLISLVWQAEEKPRAFGVDVSAWQDDNTTPQRIDWAKLAQKAEFVFIRGLTSSGLADQDFAYNWAESKRAGLPRGAYAYLTPAVTAKTAAQRLFDALGGDTGELPVVADYEHEGWSSATARLYLKTFLLEVERLTGKKPLIYTSAYKWQLLGSGDAFWAQYPLWIAHYRVTAPSIPKPWVNWIFWQYDTAVIVPGVWGVESKEIDVNWFNGTSDELRAYLGKPAPEPEPEPEPEYQVITTRISPSPTVKTVIEQTIIAGAVRFDWVTTINPASEPPAPPDDEPPAPPAPDNRYRFKVDNLAVMRNWGWAEPQDGRTAEFLFYRLYQLKPAGGMAIQGTIALNEKVWRPWVVALQMQYQNAGKVTAARAESIMGWADNPYAGPTKGGVKKWIVADCPAPANSGQFVTVKKIVTASDGLQYAAIDYIDAGMAPPAYSADLLRRGVIHRLYQMDKKGNLSAPSGLAYDWYQPVISFAQPYIKLDDLVKA